MLMNNFIALFMESAPWLLLGLLLAGILKMFVPMSWMQRQLGGHGLGSTVKAALLGAPLPLCSCGVIPAAVALRRSGASKAATTSFLVSTPETGVDSVTVSYVLLGPFMAVVRPIAAVCSAIVAGLLVGRDEATVQATAAEKPVTYKPVAATKFTPLAAATPSCCGTANSSCCATVNTPESSDSETHYESLLQDDCGCGSGSSCCSDNKTHYEALLTDDCGCGSGSSCCSEPTANAGQLSFFAKLWHGIKYAATDLVADTALWLLVGLFFAALVTTYVPADFLARWGDGVLAMLVMVLVSIPMYICATASTPIAAGLLLAGVSPGAVLVFMLAGPATNIATLGIVTKELGKRALYGYLGGVLGVALLSGFIVNYLVATFGFEVMPQIGVEHEVLPHALVNYSALLLAVLMAKAVYDKVPRRWLRRDCCS
ncbi:SO_0444 family Cu/Zn efflux transporter [Shewanella dokdonensis]|uniref:SO_0444 family Cu/Zn efflux transporter n=1 Tax=Shewanella dokdonensis TaxID=712036 RepID=UPI0020105A66|nr:SO_0444 family Cu/Zn efflux transporter [Shewanella dokdonensis]MCL1076270.1 SO_0444 family Cu/Zn efflux transporter [Shewanella dokdonensis]